MRIGQYRLMARLGSGGMGVVYLGVDPGSREGSPVAVKVLRPELADDLDFRRRFRHEVSALMRVKGGCTVRVIEADTEADRPFMVTEYADGPSLSEYINSYGALGPEMLYGLATGLAEALTVIHAAGIVHRDLKPSNVILTDAGPKVIDFGIAHALDATSVTRTGMMVGSAGFMAPEQISGQSRPGGRHLRLGSDCRLRGHRAAAVRHRGDRRGLVPGHVRRPGYQRDVPARCGRWWRPALAKDPQDQGRPRVSCLTGWSAPRCDPMALPIRRPRPSWRGPGRRRGRLPSGPVRTGKTARTPLSCWARSRRMPPHRGTRRPGRGGAGPGRRARQ